MTEARSRGYAFLLLAEKCEVSPFLLCVMYF